MVYQHQRSNKFKEDYKRNTQIVDQYKSILWPILKPQFKLRKQNYHPKFIVNAKNDFIIADTSNFILKCSKNSFQRLYRHYNEVTCLIIDKEQNILISAGVDKEIYFYSIEKEDFIFESISISNTITSLFFDEIQKILLVGDELGFVYIYQWESFELLRQIQFEETKVTQIVSFPEKKQFLVGYNSAWFYSFDTEINRKKKKYETSGQSIISFQLLNNLEFLFVGLDNGDVNLFHMQNGDMIGNWNFSQHSLTQIIYMDFEEKLLILDEKGKIILFNHNEEKSVELRGYQKEGNWKGILIEKDEFVLLIGHKDDIEYWNLIQKEQVDIYTRYSLDDDTNDCLFFHHHESNNQILGFNDKAILTWQIDEYENIEIQKQTFLKKRFQIKKIFQANNLNEIILLLKNNDIVIFNLLNFKEKQNIQVSIDDVVSIFQNKLKPWLYIIGETGQLMIYDMQEQKILEQTRILVLSPILLGIQTNSNEEIFLLKQAGNLSQINWKERVIMHEKIIQDEDISLVEYCQRNRRIFTCSISGNISMTTINFKQEVNNSEIVEKGKEIVCLKSNKDGSLIAFATIEKKVYMYDVEDNFLYEKFNKIRVEIKDLYFSLTSQNLYACLPNGNIFEQNLNPIPQVQIFQELNNKPFVDIICNNRYIITATIDSISIWNINQKNIEYKNEDMIEIKQILMNNQGDKFYLCNITNEFQIWSLQNFSLSKTLIPREIDKIELLFFDVSLDDRIVVLYYEDEQIIVYDLNTESVLNQFASSGELINIRITPDKTRIIGNLERGQLSVQDLKGDLKCVLGRKSNFFREFLILNNSMSIVLIYKDGSIQIWNAKRGENVEIFENCQQLIHRAVLNMKGKILILLTNRGKLVYINQVNGKIIKQIDLKIIGKVRFFRLFEDTLILNIEQKIYYFNIDQPFSFPEVSYIKKAFSSYGQFSSESDFLKHFKHLKNYDKSLKLQRYFNPILICSLFNYQQALQEILQQNLAQYPLLNQDFQISPIIVAIKLGNHNIAQVILRHLSLNPNSIYWSNREMQELLNHKHEFTHRYLNQFMVEIQQFTNTSIKIPLLSQFDKKYSMYVDQVPNFTPEKFKSFTDIEFQKIQQSETQKRISNLKDKQNTKLLIREGLGSSQSHSELSRQQIENDDENQDQNKLETQKRIIWQPTKFYRINGNYNFSLGSEDSIYFLRNYSQSKDKEFVLSNWRHIIDYKWQKIFKMFIPIAIIFWLYALFLSLYLVDSSNLNYLFVNVFLIVLISIYEYFQIIVNGLKKYIANYYNISDLILIILGIIILILTYFIEERNKDYTNLTLKYFQIIQLVFSYFRSFTYLRIFKWFRNVIHMLIAITITSSSFIIIIASYIVAISVMYVKAGMENSNYTELIDYELDSVQGELNFNFDDFTWLQWFIFVVNSILLPIVLVNFLIAKMTSKYEDLEEKENFTSYIEKAKMIQEIEILFGYRQKNQKKLLYESQ